MESELRRSSRTRRQLDRYTPLDTRTTRTTGTGRGRGRGRGRGKNGVTILLEDGPTRYTFSEPISEKYWIEDMRYDINSIINSGKPDIEINNDLLNYRDSLKTRNLFANKNILEVFNKILNENPWWKTIQRNIVSSYKYNQKLANLTQSMSEARIGGKSKNKRKKRAKRVKSGKKR